MRSGAALTVLILFATIANTAFSPPDPLRWTDPSLTHGGSDPVASVSVQQSLLDDGHLEVTGTKSLPNVDGEWNQYRVYLDDQGLREVLFHANGSHTSSASSNSSVMTYEWTVINDEPYGEFRGPKGVYTENAASQGEWTYTFRNVTIDAFGGQQAEIRIELIVTDSENRSSEKYRMYFVVVPAGFGDEEPVVDVDFSLNNTRISDDTISVTGSVVSGAESQRDVFVELAFEEETFGLTPIQKFNAETDGTFAKTKDGLGDGDSFVLNLSLDGMYSNVSQTQRIFIKIYEYDSISGERWVTIKWLEVNLAPCQGLEADPDAEAAGGRFVLVDGACEWEGAWTYNQTTGNWSAPTNASDEGQNGSQGNETAGGNATAEASEAGTSDNADDELTPCEEWAYWNPGMVNPDLPGEGCPHYEGDGSGESGDSATDGSDSNDSAGPLPSAPLGLTVATLLGCAIMLRREQT